MTTIKKRLFLTSILATVGSLAVGQTALAATGAGTGDSSSARGTPARRNRKHHGAERGAHRLEQLKADLGITPEQEPAWNTYSQAMQPKDRSGDEKRPEFSKLTTPERIEYMQSRQGERQQHMDQRLDAVKRFYAHLTPEQQAIYDQKMTHAWGGKGHGQGRHRGRRGG